MINSANSARFGQSANSVDSFEANLKQIEQTNQMLNNIESKLTDFFKNAEESAQKLKSKPGEEASFRRTGADRRYTSENRSPNAFKATTMAPYSPNEKTNPFTISELHGKPNAATEARSNEAVSRNPLSNYNFEVSPSFQK